MDTRNKRSANSFGQRPTKIQPAVKAALRNIRRQDNKESILVTGTNDPKSIRRDICVIKTVETAINSTTGFTYTGIYKLLDAGTTPFFTRMRVISCSAYGTATITGSDIVQAVVDADGASFLDRGVVGSRRAALHIRFPEEVRINWVSTASTSQLITVTAGSTAEPAPVQFTIEVRGDASGDA